MAGSHGLFPPDPRRTRARQFALILLLLLAGYPLGVVVSLYSFVLRARLKLGFWPAPYRPDPKELGFDLHYLGVMLALITFPFVTLVCVGWILAARVRCRDFPMGPMLAYAGGCAALGFCLLRLDPGNFVEWFFD